jgi:hypothetical protein
VFLVLLCNDRPVLGPWVNTTRQNIAAAGIVWVLVLLSLALTAATLFPDLSAGAYETGFGVGVTVGVAAGVLIAWSRRRVVAPACSTSGGLAADRATWRTPALATLDRPVMSPLRRAGLLTLRGYLVVATVMIVVKVVQTATGNG